MIAATGALPGQLHFNVGNTLPRAGSLPHTGVIVTTDQFVMDDFRCVCASTRKDASHPSIAQPNTYSLEDAESEHHKNDGPRRRGRESLGVRQ